MWKLVKPKLSFHDTRNGHKCSDIKAMSPSVEPTDMLCKLLKAQSAPVVDTECFDGNVLEYHTSWHCSEKSLRVRFKIQEADLQESSNTQLEMPEIVSNTASNFHPMKALLRQSTS